MTEKFLIFNCIAIAALSIHGCADMQSMVDSKYREPIKPIANPFYSYRQSDKSNSNQNMILRTKKGDRSVELEIPSSSQNLSDFVLPVSPAFKKDTLNGNDKDNGLDLDNQAFKNRRPSISDNEITQTFPHGLNQDTEARQDIERELHLMPSEDNTLSDDAPSYLAALDHIKSLFKAARYEAALLEADELLKTYQTDPKLYEMRGTLLERMGRRELALKSWNQALHFDTKNIALKKFIDRKQMTTDLESR